MPVSPHDVPLPVVPFVVITAEMTVNYIPEALSNNNKKRKTKTRETWRWRYISLPSGVDVGCRPFPYQPVWGRPRHVIRRELVNEDGMIDGLY